MNDGQCWNPTSHTSLLAAQPSSLPIPFPLMVPRAPPTAAPRTGTGRRVVGFGPGINLLLETPFFTRQMYKLNCHAEKFDQMTEEDYKWGVIHVGKYRHWCHALLMPLLARWRAWCCVVAHGYQLEGHVRGCSGACFYREGAHPTDQWRSLTVFLPTLEDSVDVRFEASVAASIRRWLAFKL